jgi:hypothetical protein
VAKRRKGGEVLMAIKTGEVVNMVGFLGIGIKVELKDGRAMNFKPVEYLPCPSDRNYDGWIGTDDEGRRRTIARMDIEFVKYY